MANKLEVWLFAEHIGTLLSANGRLGFRYGADWLSRPTAVPLSCSLPLQPHAFDDTQTRPFFAGLLPEGHLRQLLARNFQVSNRNDFALLDRIGGECAGAITLLPPGATPPSAGTGHVEWLDDEQLIAILDELPHRPMLAGRQDLRLSLAGVQDKLPVVFDGRRIGLPQGVQPSTHILKPPIPMLADSVANEAFCLALATSLKLPAAQAQIHTLDQNRHFLLVSRYDRQTDTQGRVIRLHQEDFCQALSVPPELKYQHEGGPDLAACFALVRRVTRPNAPQVLRLLDYVIFNALIGNHDAHAKNFSLLYAGKSATLAPLYDALSTAVYPALTGKMAMKLGSKYKFSEVHGRHWDQFAEHAGLARAQMRKRIVDLAHSLPAVARRLQSAPEFAACPVAEQIVLLIEKRAALTVRRLTESRGDK